MANLGRLGWLGVGIESTAGVYKTPAVYVPYTANTLIGKHTPLADIAARGLRESDFSSVIGKKWGEGAVDINLDPINAGYFIKMVLGSETPTQVDSSAVYDHLFTVTESAVPVSASFVFDKQLYRESFLYTCAKDIEILVSDGLAQLKANVMSKFPITTTSGTNTTTSGSLFTFKDLTVQFGADQASAGIATPIKVKNASIKINQNLEPIYRSGSTQPDSFAVKNFEVTGECGILLEDTVDRDAYYNLTKRDAILTFTGDSQGAYYDTITIKLYNFRVEDFPIETGIDNLYAAKVHFVGEYSLGDAKTIDITVRNLKATAY